MTIEILFRNIYHMFLFQTLYMSQSSTRCTISQQLSHYTSNKRDNNGKVFCTLSMENNWVDNLRWRDTTLASIPRRYEYIGIQRTFSRKDWVGRVSLGIFPTLDIPNIGTFFLTARILFPNLKCLRYGHSSFHTHKSARWPLFFTKRICRVCIQNGTCDG